MLNIMKGGGDARKLRYFCMKLGTRFKKQKSHSFRLLSQNEICPKKHLLLLFIFQALKLVTDALSCKSPEVRVAACICLKNVSRSVKVCSILC